MTEIQMDWFDQLQINWEQAPEGFIGIHAYKQGKGCRYFEVLDSWEKKGNFLELIYEQANKEWKNKKEVIHAPPNCPVCKATFMGFDFRYKGKFFCRYCGSHYRMEGNKAIVERDIHETK